MMSFRAATLRIAFPVIVWATHFAIAYGITALACARAAPHAVPWTIGVATLGAAALMVATMVRAWPRRGDFEAWLTLALAAMALTAIVWEGMPVLIVPACA